MADEHDSTRDDPDDGLETLVLGALSEGVTPSNAQWQTIAADAGRHRTHRNWVLSAAAALVLIAISATLVLTGDDSGDLATGRSTGAGYVLPPAGSHLQQVSADDGTEGTVSIGYADQGASWVLQSIPLTAFESTPPTTVAQRSGASELAVETDRLGTAWMSCGSQLTTDPSIEGSARTLTSPQTAQLVVGDSSIVLWSETTLEGACAIDGAGVVALVDQINRLRLVNLEELRQYLGVDEQTPVTSTPPELQPPTTSPENPPADPGAARAEIAALIQDYTVPAADGTYPKLEDGVERADEYREIFVLMRKRVGIDPQAEPAPTIVTLTSIHFTSPTEAIVVWDNEVTLPGVDNAHFSTQGRALLQDGRWVMSYDTVQYILERACIPPGGRDPSCQSGSGLESADRAQVEAAIHGFDTQAADGTWPYLEDGVARAAEYKARQDAGAAAVGRTADDKAGQVHTITSLTFVSDDEADVRFDIAVTLHGQRSTYQHVARVFRQDGHWVVSRDSWFVISTVACGSRSYSDAYPDSCR